ncbi:alcohol dehydrogenase catalytic domain-containing protein [Grimontia kaedaensis]|uniref:Alcohol dehydrogenase catalytic domain-containing protein n=1 Tax=Grimontia kaedaensis TaxID=2872157 RepID=A0ABY4WZF3_9GAMM|nr:alcohol dehydrogenase catalytic domain-containing protein [Grimontia kaedaensis]USH04333.1 alcohol dehydrogenase catalytic domain-containing protein [Grimontia kaedaensis]
MTKAAFYCGDKTFRLESVSLNQPKDEEVQIQVAYCGICGTDVHVYSGHMDQRVGTHRIIGHEMSGVIRAVGKDVNDLNIGDHVVVRPLSHCGQCSSCQRGLTHICENLVFHGLDTDGAFQEYWNVPAHTVHSLPKDLSLSYSALVEPLAVACHDVSRARVVSGEEVLVIGGGPIGMLIAMVAKEAGASVSIVEVDQERIAFAAELGFSSFDARAPELKETLLNQTKGQGFHAIFDTSGVQAGVDLFTEVAATRARICMVAIHTNKPNIDLFAFFWKELELVGARVYEPEDFEQAIKLLKSKKIDASSMITGIYPLEEIQEAFTPAKKLSMKTLVSVSPDLMEG